MKPTAYLINIGRGVIVPLDALTEALQTGEIAGAALDVFEREPLPPDHPLWEMGNVILTPHIAGDGPYIHDRQMELFLENARRFIAGEPLLTVVDKAQWC
jgi:phosphoglycerate dehydrogenase-like enzyme